MANEAIMVQQLEERLLECTVADGATIEKGTLLKLTDPNTGVASGADGDIFLGIAAYEKAISDGSTRMSVWRHGVFDLKDSGSGVTVGDIVKLAGANLIATADDDTIEKSGEIVGIALQTGSASEVIEVLVGAW